MGAARDSLEIRVLRTLEELLKDRPASARQVDTSEVLERMRLEEEHRDELAGCMAELLEKGDVRGKPLRGDSQAHHLPLGRRYLDSTVSTGTNA